MKMAKRSALVLACGLGLLSASQIMTAASSVLKQVNINQADVKTLSMIKGIGDKRAKAIVDYRVKHGKYTSVEQLAKIKGISSNSLSKIKSKNKVKLVLK